MQRYRRKPEIVEAEKFDMDNVDTLAEWCGGQASWRKETLNPDVSYPAITFRGVHGATTLLLGFYLVKLENGSFDRMTIREFEMQYEKWPVIDSLPWQDEQLFDEEWIDKQVAEQKTKGVNYKTLVEKAVRQGDLERPFRMPVVDLKPKYPATSDNLEFRPPSTPFE